jgi:long-chain acyl-CoA synthetase
MTQNMSEVLQRVAERAPAHPAIFDASTALSYADLTARIDTAALALERAGVKPGDAVGLHLTSGVEYIVQNYAIWRTGAITVPIATELANAEKREILENIALDFVLSAPPVPPRFGERLIAPESTLLGEGVALNRVRTELEHPAGFRDVDAAFIRFTSGTTGQSKGVVLSHHTIAERIRAANDVLAIGPNDRVLWLLSMSYHFTVSIVAYLSFGATIVLPRNNLAAAVVEAAEAHSATFLYGSPMHCALLADCPRGKRLSALRVAISTTTAIDPAVAARFHDRYGTPIAQALGLIEIGLPCINLEFAGKKPGSVGPVLPAYELRLDDVGFGPNLKEIFFRGPGFLDAYYRPWRPREQILQDGWFATHDVGEVDADGCLYLRGRSKEVISVLGMKFFPTEVESVLLAHPLVAEAAVYAARHERSGEVPRARVVLRPGADAAGLEATLRKHCLEHLAPYKVPEQIEFVSALPRTASGKVLHRV